VPNRYASATSPMVTRIVSRGMCLEAAARRTRSRLLAEAEAANVSTSVEMATGVAPGTTIGPDVGASRAGGPVGSCSVAVAGTGSSEVSLAKASLCSCIDKLLRRRRYLWPTWARPIV
jgi:hypothetical protein